MKKNFNHKKALACAKRLEFALEKRGHGLKSLSQLKIVLNINSRATVHRIKNGDAMPSLDVAENICLNLNISIEWYLIGRGTMNCILLVDPDEIALNTQYRNQTKPGKRKIMKTAFTDCADHEITPLDKPTRQANLQLVIKKQNGH